MAARRSLDFGLNQMSKTTSTPQSNNSPNISVSPSISAIAGDVTPMEVDENITESSEGIVSTIRSSDHEIEFDTSSSRTTSSTSLPKRLKAFKWTRFWSPLEPKNKDSLYFKIMSQPGKIESIVNDLLQSYDKEPKETMLLILQFFADLCGYRQSLIGKYYNFAKGNPSEVIKMMESAIMGSGLKKTGKFLFMKASAFEKRIEHIVATFCKHLVTIGSNTGVIYDGPFLGHLLEFINCMSFSDITTIRVTGVVLAFKCLTAFVHLYDQYEKKLSEQLTDENQNSSQSSLVDKRGEIENCIEFLYIIFKRNWRINDKKCYMIRVIFVQESLEWFKFFPEVFATERYFFVPLLKLTADSNEIVRLATLCTFEKLIKSDINKIHNMLQNRIEVGLKFISKRFVDVSYKVAIKAISFFTEAVDRYSKYILKEYKVSIVQKIYHKHLSYASAAAKFLITFLRKETETNEDFLLLFARIAFSKPTFAERIPYLIEAFIEFTDELKIWDDYINIFLNEEILFSTKKQVLEIMREAMRGTLTGHCSRSRQIIKKEIIQDSDQHLAIATSIIPHFHSLMMVFQSDKKCLNGLIELLTFIDYDYCRARDFDYNYAKILLLLHELLNISTDKPMIENICKVFYCFIEKQACTRVNTIFAKIKADYVASLIDDLKQFSPSGNERSLLISLKENSFKTSIIFSKFDLTDVIQWDDIFLDWDNKYLQLLKYLIVCCKWHLVWYLRQLVKNYDDTRDDHLFYNNCKEFVSNSLQILKNADNSPEFFLIFESLCDFYHTFGTELRRKRQFDRFIIKITEPEDQSILLKFLTQRVIENSTLPLTQRQKYLNNVVDVIFMEAMPIESLSSILRFYHSHYEEFGVIINNILNQLHLAVPALSLMIIHTLTEVYEEILKKRQMIVLTSEEGKQLKSLVKKFANTKVLKSGNDALKLANMCMYYSFDDDQQVLVFLYFARYFAKILDEEAKNEAYHLFKELVTDDIANHEIVLLFANTLKPRQV